MGAKVNSFRPVLSFKDSLLILCLYYYPYCLLHVLLIKCIAHTPLTRTRSHTQDYIRKLDDACGKDGSKLCSMKAASFSSVVGKLFDQMKPGLNKIKGAGLLKEYSPWLAGFQGNHYPEHVEIPGTTQTLSRSACIKSLYDVVAEIIFRSI